MANITLNNSLLGSATYIPNEFIDNYMTAANGEYVKIYLYLLRCMSHPECEFSLSKIADHFDHTEKDVQRALKYWEKVQLLRLEYDQQNNLSGICLLPGASSSPAFGTASVAGAGTSAAADTSTAPAADIHTADAGDRAQAPTQDRSASDSTKAPDTKISQPTADDIRQFKEREEIQELIFLTETYLGRTINQSDLNFIFSWYDQLRFSPDLIEFLIENCIAKGHSSLRYMQKVAEDWFSKNIHTPEEAKQLVSQNNETYYAVMKAFGIRGRNLVPSEMDMLKKWTGVYGFSKEIISEACKRTIQNIHEPSFEYTDTILNNWHAASVHTLEDIKKADAAYQKNRGGNRIKLSGTTAKTNKFNNFQQREYDYDQLSRKLLEKSMN